MSFLSTKHYTLLILAFLLASTPWVVFGNGANFVDNLLWNIVVSFFGGMAGLAGGLLNSAIGTYVVGFGLEFQKSGVGYTVDTIWVIIRDFFNLFFIFGLVYLGFKMILGTDDSGTRRWLVSLILAALLVNFSLFITKVVVDFTNTIATQVANAAFYDANANRLAVSDSFMKSLGIQETFRWNKIPSAEKGGPTSGGVYGFIFGSAILFLVMTFVFGAGGLLLLIRYAALCLYMIFSPLMFLGWVFPSLMNVTRDYWRKFLGQAFFAPIYIVLLYFSGMIIEQFYNKGNSPEYTKALGANGNEALSSFSATIPPFIITCVFLIASIVVAKKLGMEGAGATIKVGQNMRGRVQRVVGRTAGGATAGLAARGLRNQVGRRAQNYINSDAGKRWAAKSVIGKQVFKTAQAGAKSSFDVRQVGGLGKATGLGTGVTGGYAKKINDKKKADEKFLKDIHVDRDKDSAEYTQDKMKKEKEIINNAAKSTQALTDYKNGLEEINSDVIHKSTEDLARELEQATTAFNDAQKALDKARLDGASEDTIREAEYDLESKQGDLDVKTTAHSYSQRVDGIRNNKSLSDDERSDKLKALDEEMEAEIDAKETFADNKIAELKNRVTNAESFAEAELDYANEIAYMKQLESSEKFWKSAGSRLTGGALGTTAGTIAGGAIGSVAGVAAGPIGWSAGLVMGVGGADAQADAARQSLNSIKKKYGDGGKKMADNKKLEKRIKAEKRVEKEILGSEGGSDKSKTGSSSGGESGGGDSESKA